MAPHGMPFLGVSSVDLRQCGLRLGEPEGHVHGAVEGKSGGELGAGLLRPTSLGIQAAETAMTVGYEGAHAELLGQGEGL
jgi:hypothetical protein